MKITVGSKNQAKLDAVREILQDYPHLKDAEVLGMEVASSVSEQPVSLQEVIQGAVSRAKNSFAECDYSIGLEAGFMEVPQTKSGFMNVNACAVYDGTDVHLGLSSAFETTKPEAMRLVIEDGMELSHASVQTGLIESVEKAKVQGVISVLTKGRVDRKEYVKQSLRMALMHIDQ